ncbi:MAG: MFS transporter [Burkholderiales bacterium]|nr:MFS transporter [Burkholderiales bacterium]
MLDKTSGTLKCLKTIFTPTFISIALIIFLIMTANYITFVIMVPYSMEKFGSSPSTAGLVTGIIFIGIVVGRLISGKLVKSIGFVKLLLIGSVVYFCGTTLYLFAPTAEKMIGARIVVGLAAGIVGTVTGSLAALITPLEYLGQGIAYYAMSAALALSIGPFLSIALRSLIGFQGLFWIATMLSVGGVFLISFVKVPKDIQPEGEKSFSFSDFIEPSILPFSLVGTLVFITWGNIQAYLAPYAQVNNVQWGASAFFVIYAASMLISRPFTGRVCDVYGARPVFYPSLGFLAAGLFCLWIGNNNFCILLAGVLGGLGFGNLLSLGQTVAISMVPKKRYTQATSTFFICMEMGCAIAPYITGFILPFVGYNNMFGLSALLALAGFPLYWLTMKKYRPVNQRLRPANPS